MIQVALIIPEYFRTDGHLEGDMKYVTLLARAIMSASGFDVHLISFASQESSEDFEFKVHFLPSVRFACHGLDQVSERLRSKLIELKIDLVHLIQPFTLTGETSGIVAKQLGLPLVATDLGGRSSDLGLKWGLAELIDLAFVQDTEEFELSTGGSFIGRQYELLLSREGDSQ